MIRFHFRDYNQRRTHYQKYHFRYWAGESSFRRLEGVVRRCVNRQQHHRLTARHQRAVVRLQNALNHWILARQTLHFVVVAA